MNKPSDWQLLARYLSGECTERDKEKIEEWLRSDSENKSFLEFMENVWKTPEADYKESDVEQLWMKVAEKSGITSDARENKNVKESIELPDRKKLFTRIQIRSSHIFRYAAVFFLLVSLPYFYIKFIHPLTQNPSQLDMDEIAVEKGRQAKITLSDGTNIVLDAGSVFSYPREFNGEAREVFLNGEGYFEVAHNAEKPFIVHANNAVIKVLGTKFNVRAWGKNKKVEVAVSEGKVSLRSEEITEEDAVIITVGKMSILPENEYPLSPYSVDVERHLSWQNKEIVFNDTPLYEILDQLERWYDLRFILSDTAIASDHLTVHIQNKPVTDILELISVLTDLKYEKNGNEIQFSQ